MKKKDLVVGARVAQKLNEDETGQEVYVYAGAIAAEPRRDPLNGETKVYVKWDDTYKNPNPSEIDVSELDLEDTVRAKASKLEEEFEVYAEQISEKMEAAAKLIREANKIAKKAGVENLNDMYEATSALYSAMDDAGWNTSSFGC